MRRFSGQAAVLMAVGIFALADVTLAGEPGQPLVSHGAYSRHVAGPMARMASADTPSTNAQVASGLGFYGSFSARPTVSQLPRRTTAQAATPRPIQRPVKPFQGFQADPTISPYLNLERQETADDVPNYFTFVRPQIQQQEINRSQQREIHRLQRHLSGTSTGTAAGVAPARFMDTGQFYSGWQQ